MRLPIDSDSLPTCEEENGEEVKQDGVIESLLQLRKKICKEVEINKTKAQ